MSAQEMPLPALEMNPVMEIEMSNLLAEGNYYSRIS